MIKLVGYHGSPFVKKILLVLEHKGLDYQVDELNPFLEKERLYPLNDKWLVPVLIDWDDIISESTDICLYLDKKYPENPVYPIINKDKEKSLEIERWASSQLVWIFTAGLYFQRALIPEYIWIPGSEERAQRSLNVYVPEWLSELEQLIPDDNFVAGSISVADFMIWAVLRWAMLVWVDINETNYPKLYKYLTRLYKITAFKKVIEMDNKRPEVIKSKNKYMWDIIE